MKENVWNVIPGRTHYNFKSMSSNPLKRLKLDKLNSWITAKIKETIKYRRLQEEEPDSD